MENKDNLEYISELIQEIQTDNSVPEETKDVLNGGAAALVWMLLDA